MWQTVTMSTTVAPVAVHRWVDRLTPAQLRDLGDVVNSDRRFPPLTEAETTGADDDPFLALIGAVDDPQLPADYAADSGRYAREAVARHHARRP